MGEAENAEYAISVRNLGKEYRIVEQVKYRTFQDALINAISAPFNTARKGKGRFWALTDVSFDVEEGDVLGIIGRNGAGKSTILKILSRITTPTTGSVEINGRVGSLLEVGTGFHPELTGRENIYLSGSILGMKKREIESKMDEIVKFSEIEEFLDTPTKRYSSGMYVRLAFSVAAHLEPDILIIDEVLAVGDAEFQKKCLGKMGAVAREGRTVVFVSHNMNTVEQLCHSCILLDHGRLKLYEDDVRSVINSYLYEQDTAARPVWENSGSDCDNQWIRPNRFYAADGDGNLITGPVNDKKEVWVYIDCDIKIKDPALLVGYAAYSEDGLLLFQTYQTDQNPEEWPKLEPGHQILRSRFPVEIVNDGLYQLEMIAGIYSRQMLIEPRADAPSIVLTVSGGGSSSPYWAGKRGTSLAPGIRVAKAQRKRASFLIGKRPGVIAPVIPWENFE